ncbi:hypothetical protein AN963_16660 [Brevibacillus choshinensis]|uniref:Uncharacterized protein n=1 Tax=Brevibacillus choshinensis TaxID=54911 RepID=A0ABR5N7E2_BRECH|nr:hypothetical protein [Brevibacillus choshinensis]KQL46553.1 hypothetical protein AN963_16660 [Brevibacillus choshinensis]
MDYINQMLQSTTAKKSNQSLSEEQIKITPWIKVTFTEGKNIESLSMRIVDQLNYLESQINLNEDELREVKTLISYLPHDSDLRVDGEYRISQINEALKTNDLLGKLDCKLKDRYDEQEVLDLYNLIQLKLKTTHNSPLKQSLLEKMRDIYDHHIVNLLVNVTEQQTTLELINRATTIDDLDNALLDLMIPDYINLDTKKRVEVASAFYESQKYRLEAEEEIRSELLTIIEEYISVVLVDEENLITEKTESNVLVITSKTDGIEIVDGQIRIKKC